MGLVLAGVVASLLFNNTDNQADPAQDTMNTSESTANNESTEGISMTSDIEQIEKNFRRQQQAMIDVRIGGSRNNYLSLFYFT